MKILGWVAVVGVAWMLVMAGLLWVFHAVVYKDEDVPGWQESSLELDSDDDGSGIEPHRR